MSGAVTKSRQEEQETNGLSYPTPTASYDDVVKNPDLFWEKLKSFHHSFSTRFSVPTVGGKALDLHHLFVEVTFRGGIEKVVSDRKWKDVIATFNFPPTITSASFVLRKYYIALLYHFEQVYLFNKQAPSLSAPDAISGYTNGSATQDDGVTMSQLSGCQQLEPGGSVTGIIDGKFESGYLVTVDTGSEVLKGVLYHTPYASNTPQISDAPPTRRRKRSQFASRDPSPPSSNKSGYEVFFAEHYAQLKPLYHGQDTVLGEKIVLLWNNLTEAEKQVYEDQCLKEKEGLGTTMFEDAH